MHCMTWVPEADAKGNCPICSSTGTLIKRPRRVTGWLGIQRYRDQNEFGIDFIRNGRKIEIANKDLFIWRDGDTEEREYPLDDPRNEGRIVGEIHIDHCRVSYAKDRFDRADQSWDEMVQLVRGEGPLRPEKAKSLGFGANYSPLFALFKAFRRTSPQSKAAGAYARIMIVKDNARAKEMADYFREGRPEYQDDSKWWELVEEADRELLYGPGGMTSSPGPSGTPGTPPAPSSLPPGLLGGDNDGTSTPGGTTKGPTGTPSPTVAPLPRREIPSLSRNFIHASSGATWNVTAYEVQPGDPGITDNAPWVMPMGEIATRHYHFLFDPRHTIFSSITMTPRDGLLIQLAWMTAELLRTSTVTPSLSSILAELRAAYGDDTLLDPRTMSSDASALLLDIAKALVASRAEEDRAALFNDLSVSEQQLVMRALGTRKIPPTSVTGDGSFLQYAPYEIIRVLVERHPEHCFDGKVWDEPFEALEYGDKDLTASVRDSVVARYIGLINDAIWLARQDVSDLANNSREELVRATMSLRLLKPDAEMP